MQEFKLKKGLELPISGAPEQKIYEAPMVKTVGLIGFDYLGLKPRIDVKEGDSVKCGQSIFFHKDMPEVKITSPVSGTVTAINRGPRRVLESVVIEVSEKQGDSIDFSKVGNDKDSKGITEKLCAAGLWTSFKTRPFSKVPSPLTSPKAIFVTAMDTEPLSPNPELIIAENAEAFERGLSVISKLTEGVTHLCFETGLEMPGKEIEGVKASGFSGPHPAGLAGTHIHFLEAVDAEKPVWTIGYQDVIAIGHLMIDGVLNSTRVVSLCGPLCEKPRLLRTVMGASLTDLTNGEHDSQLPVRMISGSVLSGRMANGTFAYLGRYARQITLIKEDHEQILLGWIRPMFSKFSFQPVLGSAFSRKLYQLTSNLNGGRRAMVPTGTFEQLMPQDFLPTQLLRSLLVMDTDVAQSLGALELDEEDLGLVGFACPAKYEYGLALRDCLEKIEKEG